MSAVHGFFDEEKISRELHKLIPDIGSITFRFVDKDIFNPTDPDVAFTKEEWEKATVIATFRTFPKPGRAPNLKYLHLYSSGSEHAAKFKKEYPKVAVSNSSGVHGPQISEYVIMQYLNYKHKMPDMIEWRKHRQWNKQKMTELKVNDSWGDKMGIVGYGSIGRQTAKVAHAMGMKIAVYSLRTTKKEREPEVAVPNSGDPHGIYPSEWYAGPSEFEKFLTSGLDVVVLCVPLVDATRHLFGKREFELLKGSYIINVARGGVIDTDAIIEALNNDVIGGAALDVTDPEPLPSDHPLWDAKNLALTPHLSGQSHHYLERSLRIFEENLKRIHQDRPLYNIV